MADIEKILDSLNIPKQLLDKSEQLLKTLFGQAFDELGGMIADQVKLRRFKNQIEIFNKAQTILKDKNIDPKKVSLKVLAPLIELSSYEEEEPLQVKWANLIAYAVNAPTDTVFQQNAISILNKLSTEDAAFLDDLYEDVQLKRADRFERQLKQYERIKQRNPSSKYPTYPKKPHEYAVTTFTYAVHKYVKDRNLQRQNFELMVSNLVAIGVLQWESGIHVDAEKRSDEPDDREVTTNVDVISNFEFAFSHIGEKCIKVFKGL